MDYKAQIAKGNTALGIELGSTRIKAVLIGQGHEALAVGFHDWENRLENGVWTYHLDDVWRGVQEAYQNLAAEVRQKYGASLKKIGAIGISGMMHGYLPFDKNGRQLAEFRTWRNTTTERAAAELTELLGFNIPQRWSIAHLYQAILNDETHVRDVDFLATLAGYVHWKLTGRRCVGVGEASGMFPIDSGICDYDKGMAARFDELLKARGVPWKLHQILPEVMTAGEFAGSLSKEGARLLDPTGTLTPGIPLCPPEGDAGTGMAATNSISPRTGNVSAGTSIFAMLVLEKPLSKVHTEIDIVTTPVGAPVAMVHCNTCTSDLDAWVRLFGEFAEAAGAKLDKNQLYGLLYNAALKGDPDCGGLVNINYYSGEPVTNISDGRPMFIRTPSANFSLANFMRAQIYSAVATLRIGMDILLREEQVRLDQILGHGGLFKTPVVGQKLMAGALGIPVAVMETAGEGGPWGMAILAAYMINKSGGESLQDYLRGKIFQGTKEEIIHPDEETRLGFEKFLENYKACLPLEEALATGI